MTELLRQRLRPLGVGVGGGGEMSVGGGFGGAPTSRFARIWMHVFPIAHARQRPGGHAGSHLPRCRASSIHPWRSTATSTGMHTRNAHAPLGVGHSTPLGATSPLTLTLSTPCCAARIRLPGVTCVIACCSARAAQSNTRKPCASFCLGAGPHRRSVGAEGNPAASHSS